MLESYTLADGGCLCVILVLGCWCSHLNMETCVIRVRSCKGVCSANFAELDHLNLLQPDVAPLQLSLLPDIETLHGLSNG